MERESKKSSQDSIIWRNIKTLAIVIVCALGLWQLTTSCAKQEQNRIDEVYQEAYDEGFSDGRFAGYRQGYGQAVIYVYDNASREIAETIWSEETVWAALNDEVDVYPN